MNRINSETLSTGVAKPAQKKLPDNVICTGRKHFITGSKGKPLPCECNLEDSEKGKFKRSGPLPPRRRGTCRDCGDRLEWSLLQRGLCPSCAELGCTVSSQGSAIEQDKRLALEDRLPIYRRTYGDGGAFGTDYPYRRLEVTFPE